MCSNVSIANDVEVGVDVGVGVGVGLTVTTPLFQTSFFPLFTHVNFLPLAVAVVPTFLHVSPALTAALALLEIKVRHMSKTRNFRFNFTAFSQYELCRCRLNSLGKFSLLHKSSFHPNTSSHLDLFLQHQQLPHHQLDRYQNFQIQE